MAASAYAALASLSHVLEQIQHPAWHQLRFDRSQIKTLHEMVRFMLDFFEAHSTAVYDTNEEDVLRDMANCITEAENVIDSHVVDQLSQRSAGKADMRYSSSEDVIDSHMVDQLSQRSAHKADMGYSSFSKRIKRAIQKIKTSDILRAMANRITKREDVIDSHVVDQLSQRSADKADMSYSSFCGDIERVINQFKTLKEEFVESRENKRSSQEQKPSVSLSAAAGSSAPPAPFEKNTMVGVDDHMAQINDRIAGGESRLQVVPIVGMGGIGKTTLAQNIFHVPCFQKHFDIRIWFTISQEYRVLDILLGLLKQVGETESHGQNIAELGNKESIRQKIAKLGQKLYQKLFGQRYLIVLDDIWSTDVWDDLKFYFPDTCKGSRIIVTTRLASISDSLGKENSYSVDLLDDKKSWELLCQKAFGKVRPETKFEEIGRSIASVCKGLPLAIVVIGGLLSKSNVTLEKWEEVAKNVNSFVNSEDDELCSKILSLSYKHLPIHLKPCFLYMRVYPEDHNIRVSQLIQCWIAEGFVISKGGKTLEDVAGEYLKDLIGRNLILTNNQFEYRGKMKMVRIHDLLRDWCIRENQRENTFRIAKVYMGELMQERGDIGKRNICWLCGEREVSVSICLPILSHSGDTDSEISMVCDICGKICPRLNTLRPVEFIEYAQGGQAVATTKLRYIDVRYRYYYFYSTWLHLFWNLQSLVFYTHPRDVIDLPSEIWNMPQLRHVKVDLCILPEPPVTPTDGRDSIILEGLETLGPLVDFSCSKEIIARIPNVKNMRIHHVDTGRDISYFEYHNLTRLHKLELLTMSGKNFCSAFPLVMKEFPRSLKKLALQYCRFSWKQMTIIGSLPNLEVLKFYSDAFVGESWNPVGGEFLQLKKLSIDGTHDLLTWNAEKEHFPKLESLVLGSMHSLKNFPSGIGEIDSLLSITLCRCPDELVNSAKEVVAEQQTYGNMDLQLHILE